MNRHRRPSTNRPSPRSRRLLATLLSLALSLLLLSCGSDASTPEQTQSNAQQNSQNASGENGDNGESSNENSENDDEGEANSENYIDVDPDKTVPVGKEGQYNVGYRKLEVEYRAEEDGTEEPRTFDLSVWYPTRQRDGPKAEYFTLIERESVIADAKLADVESRPLLLFSHGNGGIPQQSYFMTEHWASHGWIVASIEHVGNTLSDGTDINFEAAIYRPQDVTASLDHLFNLPEDEPLEEAIGERVVLSGHSFGGYTAVANSGADYAVDEVMSSCEEGEFQEDYCEVLYQGDRTGLLREGFFDDRIDLSIPMAPGAYLLFQEGLASIEVPTLLFTGGMDQTLPNDEEGDRFWSEMSGSKHRRVDILKAGHFTFSNMCDLFGGVDEIQNDGCSENNIEPSRAYRIINTYSLAFARAHLDLDGAERAEEIISGERVPVPEDEIEFSVGAD